LSNSHTFDLADAPGRSSKYRPQLKLLELFSDHQKPLNGSLRIGGPLKARIQFRLDEPMARFDVMLGFDNHLGQRVFTASTEFQADRPRAERVGDQTVDCEIPSLQLVPGEYKIKVLLSHGSATADSVEDAARITIIESDYYGTGTVPWAGVVVLPHRWNFY
jgi:Wzt-like putative exopolysaccharide export protein